jgi:hypothetical protein
LTFDHVKNIIGHHKWGKRCYWHLVGRAEIAAKYPKMPSTAPTSKSREKELKISL